MFSVEYEHTWNGGSMAGGNMSVETVETKPAHIETIIGMVAIVIAVLIAVSILTLNINAAGAIKGVGFGTRAAYVFITLMSWGLAAALAGIGTKLVKED